MLKNWEELPARLRLEEVRPYYDCLVKRRGDLMLKRLFDIVVSIMMLILLSPVFLLLAIAIRADSEGPVFFRQGRITQYGKEFRIFKFRTMVSNAEQMGNQVTVRNDTRITKVGSMIRDCRLDEIPQLLNILTGDMSFVGTRPEVPKYVAAYTSEMMATLLLPAGVTSMASVMYQDEAELLTKAADADRVYVEEVLPGKMAYNLRAIRHFSFWGEIRLMFKTVRAVLKKNS